MSESFFETEAAVQTANEEQPQPTHEAPPAFAVSADDFAALEERIRRAVDLVRQERQARAAAEARASELETRVAELENRAVRAEAQLQAQSPVIEQLQSESKSLRAEREQVRERVERLLRQLDALEL